MALSRPAPAGATGVPCGAGWPCSAQRYQQGKVLSGKLPKLGSICCHKANGGGKWSCWGREEAKWRSFLGENRAGDLLLQTAQCKEYSSISVHILRIAMDTFRATVFILFAFLCIFFVLLWDSWIVIWNSVTQMCNSRLGRGVLGSGKLWDLILSCVIKRENETRGWLVMRDHNK